MQTDLVLTRPIISEKSMVLAQNGIFTFEVAKAANKDQIAKAVAAAFNVHVTEVSTSVIKGKERRFGSRRSPKKLSDSKKAMVSLKKGEKIDLFDIKEEK